MSAASRRRLRAMNGGPFVSAHFSILGEAQRDATTVTCSKCGGNGRVAMHTYPGGGYQMGWLCFTCDPDDRKYWIAFDRQRRNERRNERWRERVATVLGWFR